MIALPVVFLKNDGAILDAKRLVVCRVYKRLGELHDNFVRRGLDIEEMLNSFADAPPKRGRGRPRKVQEGDVEQVEETGSDADTEDNE